MARYTEGPVGKREEFRSELLLVHAREETDSGRPLVIFIHGLNGNAFATWRPIFQSPWAQSTLTFDVGVVDYASGWRRYAGRKQFSPEEVATRLATEISQISPRRVVLVGHSMGGLIAKETAQRLYRRYGATSQHMTSLAGVVTLCTPVVGSGAARLLSFMPGPAWRDRQVLRRHSQFQKDLELFFSTWVDVDLASSSSAKVRVPVFGASASQDFLVNPMSAELGVPAPQRGKLSGGHSTSLRAPSTVTWLSATIETILELQPPRTAGSGMRAEFNGSGEHPAWEGAYREALTQFTAEHGHGTIRDVVSGDGADLPDLIVRAYSAHSTQAEVPSEVHVDVQRQNRSKGRTALGISPIGPNSAAAVQLLKEGVNAPRLRWFRASGDSDAEVVAAFRYFFDLATGAIRSRESMTRQPLAAPWEGPTDEF